MEAEQQLMSPGVSRLGGGRLGALKNLLAEEAFVVLAIVGVVATLAAALPRMVVPDTWLALVDGRWIANHGLPHTDAIGLWTRGATWVDQQWLAHLALYGVARLGGVKLVLAAAVLIDVVAICIAAYAARRARASPRSTAICLLAAFLVAPWLLQARTQTLALPLFVAVYALLAADARHPTRRVFSCSGRTFTGRPRSASPSLSWPGCWLSAADELTDSSSQPPHPYAFWRHRTVSTSSATTAAC